MRNNEIKDKGLKFLIYGISEMKQLNSLYLNLNKNEITSDGAKFMGKCL